jgi:hypothetical protein
MTLKQTNLRVCCCPAFDFFQSRGSLSCVELPDLAMSMKYYKIRTRFFDHIAIHFIKITLRKAIQFVKIYVFYDKMTYSLPIFVSSPDKLTAF